MPMSSTDFAPWPNRPIWKLNLRTRSLAVTRSGLVVAASAIFGS